MHVFSDGSQNAYTTVIYLRTATPQSAIETSLEMVKTRVASFKAMANQRKELNDLLFTLYYAATQAS